MLTQTDLNNIRQLFHEEVGITVQNELKVQLGPAIKAEFDKQLRPTIKAELELQLKPAIKDELELQLKPAIKDELNNEFKPALMKELKPFIREEMRKSLRFYPTRVEMNKKFDGVTRKLNRIIGFFDREHKELSQRVDRLEHHVGIN